MITILEIPHQQKAFAWFSNSVADACHACDQEADHIGQCDDTRPKGNDHEALSDWLSDNYSSLILETAEDYRYFFKDYPVHHQAHQARRSVRENLRRLVAINGNGFLKDA